MPLIGNVVRPDWMLCYVFMTSLLRSIASVFFNIFKTFDGGLLQESASLRQRRPQPVLAAITLSLAVLMSVFGIVHPPPVSATTAVGGEVRVVGRLPLKLDAEQHIEFIAKTKELAQLTRAKDDVITYSCNSDIEASDTYVFEEVWPSEQALKSHLQTDHFIAWWSWVQPHLSGDLVINVASLADFHDLD